MNAKKQMRTQNDDNSLSIYLKEINKIPLLTCEQEETTARLAASGDKAAKDKMVNANLRFVVNVAKKYQGQGLSLSDLISEGNIGLMNAVDKFDVDKGYHFISYAVWWIRQSILKAICEKSRMIRLPLNRANELVQIERAMKHVQEGRSTNEEIADIAEMLAMEPAMVANLISISRDMVSLENPVFAEKDSSTLGDFIEDEHYQAPEESAMEASLKDDIETALATLNHKEAEIIRSRFGLGKKAPMSLQEIGNRFKLTKERIRQIEKKAIRQLQQSSGRGLLESYVA
jgi:RNA polymerase primary sigma factor